MSSHQEKILGTDEAWDTEILGADEVHAMKSTHSTEASINEALSLQLISIRLQKGLIDSLKTIAELNGIGYQPLIRQALTRFAECEMKRIANETLAVRRHEAKSSSHSSQKVVARQKQRA